MKPNRKHIFRIILIISICLNIYFGFGKLFDQFNSPPNRIGVLSKDIKVGSFDTGKTLLELPKGLVVKDVSPRGFNAIDLFEPNRFSITITTDDENLIDYKTTEYTNPNKDIYSADIHKEFLNPPN